MSIKKNSFLVSFGTLLSRITGFFREMLIAQIFGTSTLADILNIAFRLPNLFRKILGEGAATQAFVPIYCQDFSLKFFHQVLTWILLISSIIAASLIYFMQDLFFLIAPGLKITNEINLGIHSSQICSIYLIFISLSAILGASLNAKKKFFSFAIMPIVSNFVLIIGLMYLIWQKYNQEEILIWVAKIFVISGLFQLIFMIYMCYKEKITLKFDLSQSKDLKLFFKNLFILSFGAGISQINLFISQSISSTITGCIAIVNYADRIYQLPVSILSTTISTVLLTEFSSKSHAEKITSTTEKITLLPTATSLENNQASAKLNKIISTSLLITIPCVVMMINLSDKLVEFVFMRGAFSLEDVHKTSQVLSILSMSLPGFVLVRILSSIFFANSKTLVPTNINIFSIFINLFSMLILINSYSYLSPAISSFISVYSSACLFFIYSIKHKYLRLDKDFLIKNFKFIICGLIAYIISDFLSSIFIISHNKFMIFGYLSLMSIGCICIYLLVLKIFQVRLKDYW